MSLLTPEEREKLIAALKVDCLNFMFGDGQEEEYVMSGFPEFKGLTAMTDDELLREYGHFDLVQDDTPEKRAEAWRREQIEEVRGT